MVLVGVAERAAARVLVERGARRAANASRKRRASSRKTIVDREEHPPTLVHRMWNRMQMFDPSRTRSHRWASLNSRGVNVGRGGGIGGRRILGWGFSTLRRSCACRARASQDQARRVLRAMDVRAASAVALQNRRRSPTPRSRTSRAAATADAGHGCGAPSASRATSRCSPPRSTSRGSPRSASSTRPLGVAAPRSRAGERPQNATCLVLRRPSRQAQLLLRVENPHSKFSFENAHDPAPASQARLARAPAPRHQFATSHLGVRRRPASTSAPTSTRIIQR